MHDRMNAVIGIAILVLVIGIAAGLYVIFSTMGDMADRTICKQILLKKQINIDTRIAVSELDGMTDTEEYRALEREYEALDREYDSYPQCRT